jgi:hypothetical protein
MPRTYKDATARRANARVTLILAGPVCIHNKARVLVNSVAITIPLREWCVRVLPFSHKVVASPEEKLN